MESKGEGTCRRPNKNIPSPHLLSTRELFGLQNCLFLHMSSPDFEEGDEVYDREATQE